MEVLQLLLAVVFLHSNCCYALFKLAGPYEVTIEDFKDCDEVGTGQIRHIFRVRKVNSTTRLIQGQLIYGVPFDEKLSYEMNAAKWTSGGWGKNAYNMKGDNFCTSFSDIVLEYFEMLYTALGITPKCPIAAGSYTMESGMELVLHTLKKFPSLPYGRYRAEIQILLEKVLVGCVQATVSIDEIATNKVIG